MDQLLDSVGVSNRRDLYRAILGTVVHLAEERTDALDLKLARPLLPRWPRPSRSSGPSATHARSRSSARPAPSRTIPSTNRHAACPSEWRAMAGWWSRQGPGIMAAGMEGAGQASSLRVNIRLPHQGANPFIAQNANWSRSATSSPASSCSSRNRMDMRSSRGASAPWTSPSSCSPSCRPGRPSRLRWSSSTSRRAPTGRDGSASWRGKSGARARGP